MADHKKVDIESVDKRMEVIIGARVIFKSEKLVFSRICSIRNYNLAFFMQLRAGKCRKYSAQNIFNICTASLLIKYTNKLLT